MILIMGWTPDQWRWAAQLYSMAKMQPALHGSDALQVIQEWWNYEFFDDAPLDAPGPWGEWVNKHLQRVMLDASSLGLVPCQP